MAPASASVSAPVTPQPTVPDEPMSLTSLLAPRCVAVIPQSGATRSSQVRSPGGMIVDGCLLLLRRRHYGQRFPSTPRSGSKT